MLKLRINPIAKQDLYEINEYISKDLNNPMAAQNVVSNIVEGYKKLKEFPMLGLDLSSKIDIETDFGIIV